MGHLDKQVPPTADEPKSSPQSRNETVLIKNKTLAVAADLYLMEAIKMEISISGIF